jgi:hypothetical protein
MIPCISRTPTKPPHAAPHAYIACKADTSRLIGLRTVALPEEMANYSGFQDFCKQMRSTEWEAFKRAKAYPRGHVVSRECSKRLTKSASRTTRCCAHMQSSSLTNPPASPDMGDGQDQSWMKSYSSFQNLQLGHIFLYITRRKPVLIVQHYAFSCTDVLFLHSQPPSLYTRKQSR